MLLYGDQETTGPRRVSGIVVLTQGRGARKAKRDRGKDRPFYPLTFSASSAHPREAELLSTLAPGNPSSRSNPPQSDFTPVMRSPATVWASP